MIEISHLTKRYGRQVALSGISLHLAKGSITGITGANGAGKSTLFDILATLDGNYEGNVFIAGCSLKKSKSFLRKRIGYVPGSFSLYPELTVKENISFFSKMYDTKSTSYHDSPFWESLKDFENKQADTLSGGMKQKLSMICAMVHSPDILLLDEPTTGIDQLSRGAIWGELKILKEKGTTIVASTHYYEEFNHMDNLLYLHEGRQLFFKPVEEIRGSSEGNDMFYEEYLSRWLKQ